MNIRKAQLKDIVDIVKLEESVFHESLGESFLYDEMSLNPFSKMFVIMRLKRNRFLPTTSIHSRQAERCGACGCSRLHSVRVV